MARIRSKGKLIAFIAIFVIIVAAVGYVVRDRFAGETADAADSTAVTDSTAVAEEDGDKKEETGPKEDPPVPVEVAQVEHREISSYYATTASLEPDKKVDILAKTANAVAEILVEEGDLVKKGQVLCRLEDAEQRVALAESKINEDQKKNDFERIGSMYKQNLISEKEYLDTKYQYELAVNAREAAALRYEYTRVRAPLTVL